MASQDGSLGGGQAFFPASEGRCPPHVPGCAGPLRPAVRRRRGDAEGTATRVLPGPRDIPGPHPPRVLEPPVVAPSSPHTLSHPRSHQAWHDMDALEAAATPGGSASSDEKDPPAVRSVQTMPPRVVPAQCLAPGHAQCPHVCLQLWQEGHKGGSGHAPQRSGPEPGSCH